MSETITEVQSKKDQILKAAGLILSSNGREKHPSIRDFAREVNKRLEASCDLKYVTKVLRGSNLDLKEVVESPSSLTVLIIQTAEVLFQSGQRYEIQLELSRAIHKILHEHCSLKLIEQVVRNENLDFRALGFTQEDLDQIMNIITTYIKTNPKIDRSEIRRLLADAGYQIYHTKIKRLLEQAQKQVAGYPDLEIDQQNLNIIQHLIEAYISRHQNIDLNQIQMVLKAAGYVLPIETIERLIKQPIGQAEKKPEDWIIKMTDVPILPHSCSGLYGSVNFLRNGKEELLCDRCNKPVIPDLKQKTPHGFLRWYRKHNS